MALSHFPPATPPAPLRDMDENTMHGARFFKCDKAHDARTSRLVKIAACAVFQGKWR